MEFDVFEWDFGEDGVAGDYHYDFLGQIHDLKVDKKHLWLGTSNGLLKFKWTKD